MSIAIMVGEMFINGFVIVLFCTAVFVWAIALGA